MNLSKVLLKKKNLQVKKMIKIQLLKRAKIRCLQIMEVTNNFISKLYQQLNITCLQIQYIFMQLQIDLPFIQQTSKLALLTYHKKFKNQMLHLLQEKHLVYFDSQKQYFSSFTFTIKEKQQTGKKDKNRQDDQNQQENIIFSQIAQMMVSFRIQNKHVHQWQSEFYDLKTNIEENKPPKFGNIPFSLQTYFSLYKDPKIWWANLTLKTKYSDVDQKKLIESIKAKGVGKLIITTNFEHVIDKQPFILPVLILDNKQISIQSKKIIKIITLKDDDTVVCSGIQTQKIVCGKVNNFRDQEYSSSSQYYIYTFQVNEKVNAEHICILKHNLYQKQFAFQKIIVKFLSPKQIMFIPTLAKTLQDLKSMIELQNLIIIQNVQTDIEDSHGIVFYSDSNSLSHRIFRSYLYDKIQDKWLIQGMVHYTRSNKQFQDCVSQLIELITQGQEVYPLVVDKYHFDQVWKIKARFFFYILANFKITRDYGSSSLVSLILEYAKKRKISSIYLFRRLKKKYGLDGSFRGIYEQQFIKSTGINRIFYELIDIRRDNSVKYIVRQKSLANKFFKTYNLFRIKLEQSYGLTSQLMDRIIKKNKYDEIGKKKDLQGALAVPLSIKCLPYFKGKVTVESDACEPFQLQLLEQNIIEKTKQSSNLRARPVNRKPGQQQKGIDGFNWMMIDTAYVFPAVYKNQNIRQNVILQKIKKTYDSEQEQIKVLNCISSRDHSQNQLICKALLEKLKMQPKAINTTISVKRKILQIIPIFINKLKDSNTWQDYYMLFKLYQPPCYDHSDEGFQFMLSLIESASQLIYSKQFNYYFDQLHRIMLAILVSYQNNSQQKQQKIRILLIKALLKWKSKYSFQILKQVYSLLQIKSTDVRNNLHSLKAIFPNLIGFIDEINTNVSNRKFQFISKIQNLILKCVDKDYSGELYAEQFIFQLQKKQKYLKPLQFLRQSFTKLQKIKKDSKSSYWICLKLFKNMLNSNKKKYGLQIQLDELNQNQSYFLAEYLWKQLCEPMTLSDPKIHLQWIKIYRIFYFYFTPIITIYKLKKNLTEKQFLLDEAQTEQVLQNIAKFDFIPDIKWFSGYDSSGTKQQKAKYEQYNLQNNRRKRKYQELTFQEDNIITRFVLNNPGKDNWQDLARKALDTIIVIEETKQVQNPDQSQKFRKIVEGLKSVQNNLKRGNMPNDYTLDTLRLQAQRVLRNHDEDSAKFQQIFKMVYSTVESINYQKKQKQIERQNEMKIFIPKDYMNENQGEEDKQLHSIRELEEYEQMQDENQGQIVERQKNDEEQNLQVRRYESIFDQ